MNDTDSLQVYRLQSLKRQPKTIRGCCILWYASLNDRPCMRIFLVSVFSIFVLIHSFSFLALLYLHYEKVSYLIMDPSELLLKLIFCVQDVCKTCHLTAFEILLPILLLTIYPLIAIPFIIWILVKDILIKKEGLMVWHRNSLGVLLQRFFFTLIIMSSVLTFTNCIDTPEDAIELRQCFVHTGIPLVFVVVFVFMKVLCLREQRMILWTGFILSMIA